MITPAAGPPVGSWWQGLSQNSQATNPTVGLMPSHRCS
jgi:hypothetical protein